MTGEKNTVIEEEIDLELSGIKNVVMKIRLEYERNLMKAAEDHTKNKYLERLARAERDAEDFAHELANQTILTLNAQDKIKKLEIEKDELNTRLHAERLGSRKRS